MRGARYTPIFQSYPQSSRPQGRNNYPSRAFHLQPSLSGPRTRTLMLQQSRLFLTWVIRRSLLMTMFGFSLLKACKRSLLLRIKFQVRLLGSGCCAKERARKNSIFSNVRTRLALLSVDLRLRFLKIFTGYCPRNPNCTREDVYWNSRIGSWSAH